MTPDRDPPRLSDTSSPDDALLRAALKQARKDISPDEAIARMAARLPLGGPFGGGGDPTGNGGDPTGNGGGPTGNGVGPAATGGAASALPAATPLLSSIGVGALAGVVASVGLWVSGLDPLPPAPPVEAPPALVAPVRAPSASPDLAQQPRSSPIDPGPAAHPVPDSQVRAPKSPDSTAPPEAGPKTGDTPALPTAAPEIPVSETLPSSPGAGAMAPSLPDGAGETEGAFLARAQAQLGSNPAAALALTEQHRSRYPKGALGQEAEVIAITAFVRLGRTAEARTRAEAMIAAHPGSAYRRRLSVIVPGLPAEPAAP